MSGEAVVHPETEAGDWRSQLQPDSRLRIVNKIMQTLKRHLPFAGEEGLLELKKIAMRLEEKIYSAATSQSDYSRKISLKMLTMETKSQNPMANPLQPNDASNSENPQDSGSHKRTRGFNKENAHPESSKLKYEGSFKKGSTRTKAASRQGGATTKLQNILRRYSTRSSLKNTNSDPIILEDDNSPDNPGSQTESTHDETNLDWSGDEDEDMSHDVESQIPSSQKAPGYSIDLVDCSENSPSYRSPHPETTASLDLSLRRANLLVLGASATTDLSFIYLEFPNSPSIHGHTPSQESLINAKTMILNFAELGLLNLSDSQKATMLSAASLLLSDPDISHSDIGSLLEQLPSILSRSATAYATSLDMFNSLNSFKLERQKIDDFDHQDQLIYAQLVQASQDFDTEAAEVQRLEGMKKKLDEEIDVHRAKMAAHLEVGESFRASLTKIRQESILLGQQLLSRKDEYQAWVTKLREAEATQEECQSKWERLCNLAR